MNKKHLIESIALIFISLFMYLAGFEIQNWLFSFTEHMSGVNWFYLPSGLRVLLVMVAGAFGAIGIALATVMINLLHTPDIRGGMMIATALSSGFGAWVALWVLRSKGVIAKDLNGLSSSALLQFAVLFSVLNAVFHQSVWFLSSRSVSFFMIDIWPMFIGDLLGATVFLYGLKLVLWLMKTRNTSRDNFQK